VSVRVWRSSGVLGRRKVVAQCLVQPLVSLKGRLFEQLGARRRRTKRAAHRGRVIPRDVGILHAEGEDVKIVADKVQGTTLLLGAVHASERASERTHEPGQ